MTRAERSRRDGGVRWDAIRRSRRGPRAQCRPSRPTARRTGRRPRRRCAVGRRAPPARAAQPGHIRGDVPRARAPALAGRLPHSARRYARARPLADAHVRARDSGALPPALRRTSHAGDDDARELGAGSSGRRARACDVPHRPGLPPAASVRGLGGLRAGARRASVASSSPEAGTPPRRAPSASFRATRTAVRSRWRTGWRAAARASASCSHRPTRRSVGS